MRRSSELTRPHNSLLGVLMIRSGPRWLKRGVHRDVLINCNSAGVGQRRKCHRAQCADVGSDNERRGEDAPHAHLRYKIIIIIENDRMSSLHK